MQPSYPYSATDQLLILSWAFDAGFVITKAKDIMTIFRNNLRVATVSTDVLFDRLVAEIAQLASRTIVFHMGEHAFITLKKLQPETIRKSCAA